MGFEPRYITLSVPILCAVYLALLTYLPKRAGRRCARRWCLCAIAAIPGNARSSVKYARDLRNHLRHFDAQMVAGVPPHILIQRHWPYLYPQQQLIADYLPMLRKAQIGDFSKLTNDPPFREVPLPMEPFRLHKMEWRDSTARSVDWESYAAFRLPTEMVVAGIRIAYNATNQRKVPPCVKLEWNGEAKG